MPTLAPHIPSVATLSAHGPIDSLYPDTITFPGTTTFPGLGLELSAPDPIGNLSVAPHSATALPLT